MRRCYRPLEPHCGNRPRCVSKSWTLAKETIINHWQCTLKQTTMSLHESNNVLTNSHTTLPSKHDWRPEDSCFCHWQWHSSKSVLIWPYIVRIWRCRNKCGRLFVYPPHSLSSYGLKSQSCFMLSLWSTAFVIWCCYYIFLLLWPSSCTYYERSHAALSVFPPSLSVPVSPALCVSRARFLWSSLAARLAGCQLLIYTGNILAMMAAYGLCQTEYNKQEIRFQTGWLAYVKRKRNDSNHYCIITIKQCTLSIIR